MTDFTCPISGCPIYDPVMCRCEPPHLFDLPFLERWLRLSRTCPMSRQILTLDNLNMDADAIKSAFPEYYAQYFDMPSRPDDEVAPVDPLIEQAIMNDEDELDLVDFSDTDDDDEVPHLAYNYDLVRNTIRRPNLLGPSYPFDVAVFHPAHAVTDITSPHHQSLHRLVRDSNRFYLFHYSLFNVPLQFVQARYSGGAHFDTHSAFLRMCSNLGVFVYDYVSQGHNYIITTFPYLANGSEILHASFTTI